MCFASLRSTIHCQVDFQRSTQYSPATDVFDTSHSRGDAAVAAGGEDPGVDDVGLKAANVKQEAGESDGVALHPFADHGGGDAGGAKFVVKRAAAGQRADMDVEFVTRQTGGEHEELLLGSGTVECRNDVEDFGELNPNSY